MPPEDRPHENDDEQTARNVSTSRRRFLEATGAAGLVGGVGGFAMAQGDGSTTYEFGGEVAGWQGRSPSAIEGETNPTLQLEAGTEYEVVWENLDGLPHDFKIQDANGNNLAGTEIISEEGATASFTFTASEEMAQYICTVHPSSMVGDIEMGGGGAAAEQTATPQQPRFVPAGPTVGAQKVADGPLVNPVVFRSIPGMEGTHVIVDQPGRIYLHQGGELQTDPVLDITDRVMMLADTKGDFPRAEGFDERGLLGMAFHPNFQENGQFYLRYSSAEPSGDTLVGPGDRQLPENWDHVAVLAEFQMADGDGQVQMDPDSERVLLEVPEPQFNHNGGEVMFGPDGYLYTTLGDGGGANDTGIGHVADWYEDNDGGNGQAVTENLLGSILRINVDEQSDNLPYAVPDDNPLVGTEGMDEIYAWGFRNPWRASVNDGTIITADVGQNLFEEVDRVEMGGNYGWNVREGFHCFNAANATEIPDQCPTEAPSQAPFNGQPLTSPQLEYPHTYRGNQVGISVTGGYVYQGDQLPDLSSQYVFGDWSQSFVEPQGRVFVANTSTEETTGTEMTEETPAMDGNETAGTETDVIGNASVGQEEGEAGNETGGDATETDTAQPVEEQVDLMQPSEQPWPYQEVMFEGGENQRLNRFIQAFGRDDQGNVYVLASETGRLTSEAGEVYRLVPAGEGEEITPPPTPTPEMDAAENETGGNETSGNETGN